MVYANHKPLIKLGMEELAARQRSIKPSGGVLFARTADREKKTEARNLVLELFHPDRWSERLHMLTMPGVQWRFERLILGMRDVGWMRRSVPLGTRFTSVENDRAIYFSSVSQMPGLHTSTLKLIRPFPFAEIGVKTAFAAMFFANIDDFMAHKWADRAAGDWAVWDAAWLDYTGPLSKRRLWLIQQFFKHHIKHILIVTALKARWDRHTGAAIRHAGGHSNWLRKHLPGKVLHDIEYADISPIAQFAVQHRESIRFFKSTRGLGDTRNLT